MRLDARMSDWRSLKPAGSLRRAAAPDRNIAKPSQPAPPRAGTVLPLDRMIYISVQQEGTRGPAAERLRIHILSELLNQRRDFMIVKKGHRPASTPSKRTHVLSDKPFIAQN